MNSETAALSSDELLEKIFDITHNLYKEMSGTDSGHIKIFRLLTDLGRVLVNADRASFWKWDKRAHTLWTAAAVNADKIVIPEGTGMVGKALSESRPIISNDVYSDPDFNPEVDKKTGYVTRSVLVMPVSNCKGELIGAYQVINKLSEDGCFDLDEDVKRLSLAAFICGITLESEIFLDESQRDKLTELKNRVGFYSEFEGKYAVMLGENRPVSLFICDIDHFKRVNDTYGHNAGDAVLRHVANIFRANSHICDGIYRWGGEEFIVILPDADLNGARDVAEKLRLIIMESPCAFEDIEIKVTMSFGVTQIDPTLSVEENVKAADEKLYKAKESGRNKVIV